METLEVRVPNKKARALRDQLADLGIISIGPGKPRELLEVIDEIHQHARRLPRLTDKEIQEEVDAVRAKRHAGKTKGRR